jgi:hypothetical protein
MGRVSTPSRLLQKLRPQHQALDLVGAAFDFVRIVGEVNVPDHGCGDGFQNETKLNIHSKKFRPGSGNVAISNSFSPCATTIGESDMKKISCVLAALATIAVAAPTVASAQGFSFRIGSDRDYYYRDPDDYRGPRAEFYEHDRGLHRGWYNHDGDRTVIIKRHHYWDD